MQTLFGPTQAQKYACNMLERLYVRLEILGYSRAIGKLAGYTGITEDHIQGLYDSRRLAIKKLAKLKAEAREQRFVKAVTST